MAIQITLHQRALLWPIRCALNKKNLEYMKLKHIILLTVVLSACETKVSYIPEDQLSPQRQDVVLSKLIRYAGRKPEKATDSTKFSLQFDEHYLKQVAEHKLNLYFVTDTKDHYFLISRKAPSLFDKYVATGGRFKMNAMDSLVEYEEIFRTWKMPYDTLMTRGSLLFDKMVKGESLESYLTKNSGGVEYIEFPDDNVYYDKQSRKWKSNLFGSVEEMVGVD